MNNKQAKRLRRYVNTVYSAFTEEQRRIVYQTVKDQCLSLRSDQRSCFLADKDMLAEIRVAQPDLPLEKLDEALQVEKAIKRINRSLNGVNSALESASDATAAFRKSLFDIAKSTGKTFEQVIDEVSP